MANEGIPSERGVQIDVGPQMAVLDRSPSEDHSDSSGFRFLLPSPIDLTTTTTAAAPHIFKNGDLLKRLGSGGEFQKVWEIRVWEIEGVWLN